MRVRSMTAGIAAVALTAGLVAAAPSSSRSSTTGDDGRFDLSALPEVTITGPEIVDGLEEFLLPYPVRITATPNAEGAAEFLRADMEDLGYETEILPLPTGTPAGNVDAGPLHVVMATKTGTTLPDEWIMLVGHYDSVPQTIDGAYDNGSGSNMIRQLAHALADVPTNRSIVFAWYNGEEEGKLASEVHAPMLREAGQEIAMVMGFDMVGIAWPTKDTTPVHCLCIYHGPEDEDWAVPLAEYVNYEFLGFPDGRGEVVVVGPNVRNSDEQNFALEGFRTFRLTGMRTAGDYPAYHAPDDTLETIYATAGGREFFEEGSLNTLKSAYYTALNVDNARPVARFTVTTEGRTVTLDASSSSDADGEPSSFRWDLGDGTTATGARISHTYSRPGDYGITLTVADNLWPKVASRASTTASIR